MSKALAREIQNSVLIEGDDIYHQVVNGYKSAWEEGNHLDTFWKVCVSMIKAYLEDDFNVIFNYIVNTDNIEYLKTKLNKYDIKFTLLMVDEKTLIKRDVMRPLDCQMGNRCLVLLNKFKNAKYENKYILDTSKMSIKAAVKSIIEDERFYVK